ncbi:unnamed protein product [Symbiodinium sp. CCMP2456]|nr:unnamed protein product [Symbiodinium sp. CCMP2456]
MARCPVRAGAKSAARRAEDGTERLSGSFAAPLPCLDDLRGLAALAWLSQRWEALLAWWQQADGAKGKPVLRRGSIHFCQDSRPPGEVLELVYVGGAMLRESCELNSAEVAVVHCGERVLLLQEVGRRARVRTVDGFIGWISLYTADNVPIARKVSRDVQHSFKDRGRASFREEFEQKWRRLRVDPGPPEGRIHALRQSAGRVPISEWRPSGMPGAPSPQRTPPVPRLSPPSSTPQKDNTPAAASSCGGATVVVRPMEDLLDLSEEKEPPSSQRSRVPDLAEVLSAAAGSSPPTYRELCADGDGDATASSGIPEAPPSRERFVCAGPISFLVITTPRLSKAMSERAASYSVTVGCSRAASQGPSTARTAAVMSSSSRAAAPKQALNWKFHAQFPRSGHPGCNRCGTSSYSKTFRSSWTSTRAISHAWCGCVCVCMHVCSQMGYCLLFICSF